MSTSPFLADFNIDFSRPVYTLVELADRFGDIPANRICMSPAPGQATEQHVLAYQSRHGRLFELVERTLIEKAMGTFESFVAIQIAIAIGTYLKSNPIGFLLGADGMLRLQPDLIRIPDVSFISTERGRQAGFPHEPIASLSPDLAVEVISPSNGRREMADKLKEYFDNGSLEVWYVYPQQREVHRYTSVEAHEVLAETAMLTTPLLPSFELRIAEVFVDPLTVPPPSAPG
ncbi:Uma2 family endonuclease [Anatilimnocola sp. NA78]|uniref:Uma2 family endonuclease n=1 Tax=Anatilimnocola sp. NA78 TaxID=3415683 RepID=UPI003CE5B98E